MGDGVSTHERRETAGQPAHGWPEAKAARAGWAGRRPPLRREAPARAVMRLMDEKFEEILRP